MRPGLGSPVVRRMAIGFVAALALALLLSGVLSGSSDGLTITADRRTVYSNTQRVMLSGTIAPATTGKSVYVERRKRGSLIWRSKKLPLREDGDYSWSYRPTASGTWYFRSRVGTARSKTVSVVVKKPTNLVLASTTSTQDSGLFDVLIPAFNRSHPEYLVNVIAVGSGEAMEIGRRKDADTLLVHSPAEESAFVADGYGANRTPIMFNDFVLVGPESDPAKTLSKSSIVDCMKAIGSTRSAFVSRGDNSGTHAKEKGLWTLANVAPTDASWYLSVGQGMSETLRIAEEKPGYTLADRATWLVEESSGLRIVREGDVDLRNQYSVIDVVGARNRIGAERFRAWITGDHAQNAVIGAFGVKKYGQRLFTPNAP